MNQKEKLVKAVVFIIIYEGNQNSFEMPKFQAGNDDFLLAVNFFNRFLILWFTKKKF